MRYVINDDNMLPKDGIYKGEFLIQHGKIKHLEIISEYPDGSFCASPLNIQKIPSECGRLIDADRMAEIIRRTASDDDFSEEQRGCIFGCAFAVESFPTIIDRE